MEDVIFESARQFARRHIYSERELRLMIDAGEVPGIQTAKGFKINCRVFLEQLNTLSIQHMKEGKV